jgi:hypothetical protein
LEKAGFTFPYQVASLFSRRETWNVFMFWFLLLLLYKPGNLFFKLSFFKLSCIFGKEFSALLIGF